MSPRYYCAAAAFVTVLVLWWQSASHAHVIALYTGALCAVIPVLCGVLDRGYLTGSVLVLTMPMVAVMMMTSGMFMDTAYSAVSVDRPMNGQSMMNDLTVSDVVRRVFTEVASPSVLEVALNTFVAALTASAVLLSNFSVVAPRMAKRFNAIATVALICVSLLLLLVSTVSLVGSDRLAQEQRRSAALTAPERSSEFAADRHNMHHVRGMHGHSHSHHHCDDENDKNDKRTQHGHQPHQLHHVRVERAHPRVVDDSAKLVVKLISVLCMALAMPILLRCADAARGASDATKKNMSAGSQAWGSAFVITGACVLLFLSLTSLLSGSCHATKATVDPYAPGRFVEPALFLGLVPSCLVALFVRVVAVALVLPLVIATITTHGVQTNTNEGDHDDENVCDDTLPLSSIEDTSSDTAVCVKQEQV